jgi:hypothetical protein
MDWDLIRKPTATIIMGTFHNLILVLSIFYFLVRILHLTLEAEIIEQVAGR